MSVLSFTDIFPDPLTTDLVIDHQHTPVAVTKQDITILAAKEPALAEKMEKLERREEILADRIIRLQKRTGWVELAELE
jgi:hypothetical protein